MISGGMNDQHPDTYWMYGMYVSPLVRGSGVADQLVDTVEAWAKEKGATALYLHVTSTVVRARAFYERIGFVETGERFTMPRNVSLELLDDAEITCRRLIFAWHPCPRRHCTNYVGASCAVTTPNKSVEDPRDEAETSLHFGGYVGERLVVSASFFPSTSPLGR